MLNNIINEKSKRNFENGNNLSIENKDIISSIQKQIEKQNSNVFEISKINTSLKTETTTIKLKKTENTVKDSIK